MQSVNNESKSYVIVSNYILFDHFLKVFAKTLNNAEIDLNFDETVGDKSPGISFDISDFCRLLMIMNKYNPSQNWTYSGNSFI